MIKVAELTVLSDSRVHVLSYLRCAVLHPWSKGKLNCEVLYLKTELESMVSPEHRRTKEQSPKSQELTAVPVAAWSRKD